MSIRSHWRYLLYVLRHKWFVYREGRKLGLGRWRLLVHDLSKFSHAEWGPYVRWFYDPPDLPVSESWYAVLKNRDRFTSVDGEVYLLEAERRKRAFDVAWHHHWWNNRHHWDAWLVMNLGPNGVTDTGEMVPLAMPDEYRREMLADWHGAGLAQGKPDTAAFYAANGPKMRLHPETRAWVESALRATNGD